MSPAPLDAFLAQMASLLDGTRSARDVERTLGRSASGTARVALYATVVGRQQRGVLDAFYAAARVACGPGFAAHCTAFLHERPPSHWVPAAAAEHFGEFLERRAASADVRQLVDFAWTRHEVLHASAADDASGLAVRHYEFGIRDFSRQVEQSGLRKGRPLPGPETWLIGRSRATAELVVLAPSLAALVAVQVVADQGWSADLPVLPRAQVRDEAEHLFELGLLSAPALATVEK